MQDYNEDPGLTRQIMGRLSREDRFSNYREITARFNSTGKCGHVITKGSRIGYSRRYGCKCSVCWEKWVGENAAAEHDERFMAAGND